MRLLTAQCQWRQVHAPPQLKKPLDPVPSSPLAVSTVMPIAPIFWNSVLARCTPEAGKPLSGLPQLTECTSGAPEVDMTACAQPGRSNGPMLHIHVSMPRPVTEMYSTSRL